MDPMAGGLMNQGHQCGMLWGAALAAGAEACRRHEDKKEAMAVALQAVQHILESFKERTGTVNCREIIGIDISKTMGMMRFIIRTTFQGVKNNPCFRLAEDWAPEAVQAAAEGTAGSTARPPGPGLNCASEVVRKMGGTDSEQVMVAGFAGGLGLGGNACGALSAAIWMRTLEWCRENPGKNPPYFNNRPAKKILRHFNHTTGGEMICHRICGKKFEDVPDHSEFIKSGGCAPLIDELAKGAYV